ncbi:G-patch domain-containing protein [Drechmeria coniospora]|uniref:G-patch domain-containing protein n=1 Tax=Drechmeria coniospora TaxID=98403 RepID=A0A151GTK8_DRECN|nr:G-patch domain-containing protein [Drechmeria coniospora]KYK60456.1 G-patch domain-containing protein [Drechmeria coniospora]ODA80610.1 hypothetical protein RJ55_03569 [Drechmeria coniospora]
MADHPPPPPSRGLFSLYDNLKDPNDSSSSTTISAAPVVYNQGKGKESKKPTDAALLFQPQIRRPAPKQVKPKTTFPKIIRTSTNASNAASTAVTTTTKTSLADWAATEEDDWMYGAGEKRARGGRKIRKKRQREAEFQETNWDEFYDLVKTTIVDDFAKSDEKVREVLDWKDLLYRRAQRKRGHSELSSDDEDDSGPVSNQFAPPPAQFAPPPRSPPNKQPGNQSRRGDFADRAETLLGRRSLSQSPSPPRSVTPPPPPAPPPAPELPPSNAAVISRAPVRYTQPQPATEEGNSGEVGMGSGGESVEEPRSRRPGQAGFAHRLMSKYGWTAGTGLGAKESGIVNPLRVQVEKRRKKADADGGGWAEPGGKGKIIGGKRKGEESQFGKMSEVIVLRNMLENMPDLQSEISNGLGQEIGEECGEKYGRVERIYVDQQARQVFIKFTDQVSALRAVNELDGRIFNGNAIVPRFYDTDKFEKGVYTIA